MKYLEVTCNICGAKNIAQIQPSDIDPEKDPQKYDMYAAAKLHEALLGFLQSHGTEFHKTKVQPIFDKATELMRIDLLRNITPLVTMEANGSSHIRLLCGLCPKAPPFRRMYNLHPTASAEDNDRRVDDCHLDLAKAHFPGAHHQEWKNIQDAALGVYAGKAYMEIADQKLLTSKEISATEATAMGLPMVPDVRAPI